jgi:transglycosylase-like protein with SLT domain
LPESHESQTSTPVLLEVERFEQVRAGAERVLLRVDGRYGDRPGKRVLDARLFVDDGLAVHRHAPLEDDDHADGWLWRAAFEVPASYLTDARTRFALESEPGRLLDLPRPAEMLPTASVPLTGRAAHIARRYAAAVAVVLAAAVAPGGLPAHAGPALMRVHHADGTVSYVTNDGRTVAEVPADAQVVDQPAPAEAAPDPAAPDPAPEDPAPAGGSEQSGADKPAEPDTSKQADGVGTKPGPADEGPKKKSSDHEGPIHDIATPAPDNSVPAAGPATAGSGQDAGPQRSHQAPTPAGHPAAPGTPPAAPAEVAPLETLSGLALAATPQLRDVTPGPAQALPSKELQPLGNLDPAAVHGSGDTPGPQMENVPDLLAPPPPEDVPDLVTPPAPTTHSGTPQRHSGSRRPARPARPKHPRTGGTAPTKHGHNSPSHSSPGPVSGSPPSTGSPTGGGSGNVFNTLPGPAGVQGVPNFVIQSFKVPPFLLSIYQAAGIQYGIRWEVLAAINEIETDYGRNLNVSSAGALGWMQFMPSTWAAYGVDANRDGKRDPYNPVDAIFAAARYLKAAGADKDIRTAIFAYNHAGWYVDSVMLRARLIAGYPTDLIGSLTGLTEGRFPVAARARYAGDRSSQARQVQPGQNAANVIDSSSTGRGIDIYAKKGAPVVAVNDGVIKAIGRSKTKGLYVVLQDVYGNRYTYSGLGSLSKLYPVPKAEVRAAAAAKAGFQALGANDPKPDAPASAGTQRPGGPAPKRGKASRHGAGKKHAAPKRAPIAAVKQRLFAHPQRPVSKRHGGLDQLLASGFSKGFETYDNYFSRGLGLNSKNAVLRRLKVGSHVVGSTVLGRVGGGKAPHVHFEIQPAGKGAPKIDPKPFLDGWKLLESSDIYRARGRNVLYGDGKFSIGEIMLLPKPLLERRVLSDPRIKIYPGGRNDIKTGQVDRRVLVVLAYLAESGLEPTVSCLKSGHSEFTTSGNVSEHWSGNAVDIAAINGVSINGHQGPGDVTEQAVKRLMVLQGTLQPHQIISLLDFGRNTMAMSDHADHIHVGFQPLFGTNSKLGHETQSVLKPGQWDTLVQRLGEIQNPSVPTSPSRYAIPDPNRRGR